MSDTTKGAGTGQPQALTDKLGLPLTDKLGLPLTDKLGLPLTDKLGLETASTVEQPRITVAYDHAAWPAGGYYAYDESTFDGDPESRDPMGWGKTPVDAVQELAAQCLTDRRYENATPDDLARWEKGVQYDDQHTLAFIIAMREHIN